MKKQNSMGLAGIDQFKQYMDIISDPKRRQIFLNTMQVLGTKQNSPDDLAKFGGHVTADVVDVLSRLQQIQMVEKEGELYKSSHWMVNISADIYAELDKLDPKVKASYFKASLSLQRDILDRLMQYWDNSANLSAWFQAADGQKIDVSQLLLLSFIGIPLSLAPKVADSIRLLEKNIQQTLSTNIKEGMETEPPFQVLWLMSPFPVAPEYPMR